MPSMHKRIMSTLLVASTAAALSSCAAQPTDANELTFVSFGSSFQDNQKKAWQDPYTAKTGVKFRNDSPSDIAKVKTMTSSGRVTWDVVTVGGASAEQHCGELFEKLDTSVIDVNLFPAELVSECAVPAFLASVLFVYNEEKYGDNPPTTIADFFDDEQFPGKRALPPQFESGVLEQALLGDGVSRESLYPLDVDRALAKLGTIKSSITFSDTYGQLQQMMVDGQVDMALMSTNRTYQSVKTGAPLAAVWDSTIISWDSLVVPKGAPNPAAAMEFIAFTTEAPQQAALSELTTVGSANPESKPKLDPIQQQFDPFSADRSHTIVHSNAKWWAENLDRATASYTTWKVG